MRGQGLARVTPAADVGARAGAVHDGEWRIDFDNQCLWRRDQRVVLTPKAFDLLRHLLEHRECLLTKQDILKAVWTRTRVEEGQVKQFVAGPRRVLEDDPRAPRFIETVHGRGYRFIGRLTAAMRARNGPMAQSPDERAPVTAAAPIGREVAWRRLQDLYCRAGSQGGDVCLITGEAGIGKSALVEAFTRCIVETSEPLVLRARCARSLRRAEPFQPVLSVLDVLCQEWRGGDGVGCMRQHAPSWFRQMPGQAGADHTVGATARGACANEARMLREFSHLLRVLHGQRAVVLVVEDIHWADESTLHLLTHLARQSGGGCVLVLCTRRDADSDSNTRELRELICLGAGGARVHEVALTRWDEGAIARYLDARWGIAGAHVAVARQVRDVTLGNPLFVTQLAEHWRRGITAVGSVPARLRVIIRAELSEVPAGAQRVLEAASVAGTRFVAALVAEVLGMTTERVEELCESQARRSQLVRRSRSVRWRDGGECAEYEFVHPLRRQVLYDGIPPCRRAKLQERMAGSLSRARRTGVPAPRAPLAPRPHRPRGDASPRVPVQP